MCIRHATCQHLYKTTCAHTDSYCSNSPCLSHSCTQHEPSFQDTSGTYTPDLFSCHLFVYVFFLPVLILNPSAINMPETLHPFHIAFWLLHYLSAALWVVKSHTKNMVPVSIIRHGEERAKRRGGGGDLYKKVM